MKSKSAQIWTFDVVVGAMIFGFALFIFFKAYTNFMAETYTTHDELLVDAKTVSNALVYTGYPHDWNTTNYQRIGITDGTSTLTPRKVQMFKNLSKNDYDNLRLSFSIRNDFMVMFMDHNFTFVNVTKNISYVGPPSYEPADVLDNSSIQILAKITRFITYQTNESPLNRSKEAGVMVVYVWN